MVGRGAQRDEAVGRRDARDPAGEAAVGERRDHGLRDAAGAPRLVDDEHPAHRLGLAHEVVDRQRGEPAQVEQAAGEAVVALEPAQRAQAHPRAVRERHHEQVRAVAVAPRGADRDVGRRIVRRRPQAVARLVEVARRVERDRLEEDAHRAVGARGGDAGPQHRRRVVAARRRRDHEAGDVAQHGDRVVVVEVAAEPLLVAVARDPHDHRVAVPPGREELERRRLAAQLVLRVVEVREVLDLGDGQKAEVARADREAEDALLVEQRVEHAAHAGAPRQLGGDVVDAALPRHVLAEDDQLRVLREQIAERAVDVDREVARPLELGELSAPQRGARGRGRRAGGLGGDRLGRARRERRHHLGGRGEARPARGLVGERGDARPQLLVLPAHLGRGARARLDEQPRGREHRIGGLVGLDLGERAVRLLDVRAGVAEQAHGAQVEERGPPRGAHVLDRGARGVVRVRQIEPVGPHVVDPRAMAVARRDPAGGRADADPDPVVLAHEQDRHREVLERGPRGGVDRAGGRGVVRRRVAERARDDRVVRRGRRDAEPRGAIERDRGAHRLRQVRGDRRGLRRDRERQAAEHLVAPARDRIVGAGAQAEQHVEQRRLAGHLVRPREEERARSVVQERRIGGPQRGGDRGVALVPRRADRVEALAPRAERPRREIEVAAAGLRVEQRDRRARRQPRSGPDRRVEVGAPWPLAALERGQPVEELAIEQGRAVHGHRRVIPARPGLAVGADGRPRRPPRPGQLPSSFSITA